MAATDGSDKFNLSCLQCNNFEDSKIYEKPRSPLRWIVLVLACLMLIGSYYCFDLPAACKTQIETFMGYTNEYENDFSLLYTLYAIPNIILPFFGGYFVDKLGVRMCLMIFAGLVALGQVIFCLGLSVRSWPIMFIGRFVFGLGGESLTVANSALLADWFKGKELAFAFGVNLSIARLGSVINNIISPSLTASTGLVFACWFGAMVCAGSVLCVVLTLPIDKAFDDRLLLQTTYSPLDLDDDGNDDSNEGNSNMKSSLVKHAVPVSGYEATATSNSTTSHNNTMDGSAGLAANWKDYSITSQNAFDKQAEEAEQEQQQSLAESSTEGKVEPSFWDVFRLPKVFWILCILCFVIYGCVLPFNNIASSFLLERDYFQSPPSDCVLTTGGCENDASNPPVSACPSSQWYQPPLPFNVTIAGTYYPTVDYKDVDCTDSAWSDCTGSFCSRLAAGQAQSAVIMSIPYIISAVMSPILGIFIDKFGYRAFISTISPMILVIVHSLLAFTVIDPVGPMVGQGLAYTAFAAALWPSVPLVVIDRLTGLAFGVLTSVLNLGLAVIPAIVAAIYSDSGNRYIPFVEALFVSLGVVGFLVGVYLNIYDWLHDSVLNRGEEAAAKQPTDKSQYLPPEPLDAAQATVTVDFNSISAPFERLSNISDVNSENDFNSQQRSISRSSVGSSPASDRDGNHLRRRPVSTTNPTFESHDLHRGKRHGGSFTSYEEIHRGGGF